MARRSTPLPKPKSPILTVGQKRHRVERLQKCITNLEAFDPQKARKCAPMVLDKALSSAFGYGTPAYLRYNQAAILDPSPLLTDARVRSSIAPPVGGSARNTAKVQETRQHFSENKERSIALLRKAISTLEEEIADAEPGVVAVQKPKGTPIIQAAKAQATPTPEVAVLQHSRWGGMALAAAWRRVGRWWRGRN